MPYAILYSDPTGAFANSQIDNQSINGYSQYIANARHSKAVFNAYDSNTVYTDGGIVAPSSISKNSYIIYK